MKKIVVSGYVGKKITGIGRNLINLLDNASENKYVVYLNHDMVNDFTFSNPNVEVKTYSVSKSSSMGNLLWTTFIFPFMVLKELADIALIPNFTLLLLKFCPTFVIMHDLIEYNIPNKFSKLKMFYRTKLANPITSKQANRIITVSENSKRDIIKFLNVREEKITVIPNGVDIEKFRPMTINSQQLHIQRRGWPDDFILYAGTIDHPGKNALAVVKAFEQLKASNKYSGSLILAGMPGSGFEHVENYISSSSFKGDIVITGYVKDEELVALFSACKVFCFVSLYEGFGIPPLEALACGAKVVVSNVSSLPEVVGDIGWKVNPMSIEEIAQAISNAIEFSTDDEYRLHIKDHLAKYNWKDLAHNFEIALNEGL